MLDASSTEVSQVYAYLYILHLVRYGWISYPLQIHCDMSVHRSVSSCWCPIWACSPTHSCWLTDVVGCWHCHLHCDTWLYAHNAWTACSAFQKGGVKVCWPPCPLFWWHIDNTTQYCLAIPRVIYWMLIWNHIWMHPAIHHCTTQLYCQCICHWLWSFSICHIAQVSWP